MPVTEFEYVGPDHIREAVSSHEAGTPITSRDELSAWLGCPESEVGAEDGWATYVVDRSGTLRLAPRRTEHVACAAGGPVLAAGEIQFDRDFTVLEVSNNSTGYCPVEHCWPALHSALDKAAIQHPGGFTFLATFRKCPQCGERNLVKDDWFYCALCDAELPKHWNFRD